MAIARYFMAYDESNGTVNEAITVFLAPAHAARGLVDVTSQIPRYEK